MKSILTIGYDKYLLDIEDAAKVMKILGNAKALSYRWGNDEEGTHDRYVEVRLNLEISPLTHPIEAE